MNTQFNSAKSILLLLAFAFTVLGCSHEPIVPLQEETLNFDDGELSARNGTQLHFNTSLKGKNEVPSTSSRAAGQAIIKISKDESTIHFKIITANLNDVFGAHLHFAPAGLNGAVVVTLYDSAPAGPANGVLAEGNITDVNVIGAFAGDLNALIAAIRSGDIYVNVHTVAIPSGEIRGQL